MTLNTKSDRITVIVKVTSNCNLDCPYCYTKSTIKKGNPFMPIETFEKIIKDVSKNYEQATIIFHGGEPTLLPLEWYKQAVDIINKHKEMYNINFRLAMQTNLTLFDEEKFKFFSDNEIAVGFSYDGMTNHLTRKNDEVILNNYKKYSEFSFNQPGAICLITNNNYKELEKDFKLFELLDIKAKFNLVFNTVTMDGDLVVLDTDIIIEKFEWLLKRICSFERHSLEKVFHEYIGYIYGNDKYVALCTRIDCRKKWISIHFNGDAYPCGQEWGQKSKKYLLGNIHENTIPEIFEKEPFKLFYNKVQSKMDNCKSHCEIYDFCHGGCPGESFSNMGDVDLVDEHTCKFEKGMIEMVKRVLEKQHIVNKSFLKIIRGSNGSKRHSRI